MKVTIYIIDHLPCKNNELKLVTGRTLQGISDFGKTLAQYIIFDENRNGKVEAIFTSTLPRAIETARICLSTLNVPIIEDERLCAIDYGEYHDMPMEKMLSIYQNFIISPFPGGESYTQMAERYCSFLSELLPNYDKKIVIIIGHNASREMLQHCCNGIPLQEALFFDSQKPKKKDQIIDEFISGNYPRFVYSSSLFK